eukprot:TRINITY_DN963_c1_g1_i2.p1 TRINITY_DN963_c1_g1~~TRINITY_DN963_c1_g1_i2.p1  ORF type:complete len:238 (+),score=54.75 TRINITY_DN963_c1_g1_i2:42-755(+)
MATYTHYHGDAARGNQFWVYPERVQLVTPRWDCHRADQLCDHREHVGTQGHLDAWRCLGHATLWHGDASRDHKFWVYPPGSTLPNCWDCHDPRQLCNNYEHVGPEGSLVAYRCRGHEGPVQHYHGDPARDHQFWVYPPHLQLVTTRWDCRSADQLCDHCEQVGRQGDLEVWRCQGHATMWHGDASRGHTFWVYPRGRALPNCWDCHEAAQLCDRCVCVRRDGDLLAFRCLGHGVLAE